VTDRKDSSEKYVNFLTKLAKRIPTDDSGDIYDNIGMV
jgi:hypothetical protein